MLTVVETMMTFHFVTLILFPSIISASFFQIDYPNVNISAETNGDLIFEAGAGGDVILKPGVGGTVYISGVDLRKFIQKVKSLPPVWTKQSVHGTLGTFTSGTAFSVTVEAKDPDGGPVTYELVSGHLPPGTRLDNTTGAITGIAPDVDATYQFGIRATDKHGKYADGAFSIDIREQDQCSSNPCLNGGICTDSISAFNCSCPADYGGDRCQARCSRNALGVSNSLKHIPNAQLSGHMTSGPNYADQARLNGPHGWIGTGSGSWLQVDLGAVRSVSSVATQGYPSSSYYTTSYNVQYSTDGNRFTYVQNAQGSTEQFGGSSSYNQIMTHYFAHPVQARFLRFLPLAWHNGGLPGLRVEVYGC